MFCHQKKTLPDFLHECPQFSKVLQVSYDLGSEIPKLKIIPKSIALETYGLKKANLEEPVSGYDPSLIKPGTGGSIV